MTKFADIILPLAIPAPLTYAVPAALEGAVRPGVRVQVGLGSKLYQGIVASVHETPPAKGTPKPVVAATGDFPAVSGTQLRLWRWLAEYYMTPLGEVMKMCLPARLKPSGGESNAFSYRQELFVALSPQLDSDGKITAALDGLKRAREQYRALAAFIGDETGAPNKKEFSRRHGVSYPVIDQLIKKGIFVQENRDVSRLRLSGSALDAGVRSIPDDIGTGFGRGLPVLLHNKGGHKEELYAALISETLAAGKDALLLLPDLYESDPLVGMLSERFAGRTVLYYARLSDNLRAEIYLSMTGDSPSKLVIGTRQALFLPLERVGCIVVDSEHSAAYKQTESSPRYNARDVAVVAASLWKIPLLLESVSPAIESYFNARTGKYALAELRQTTGERPSVRSVDMRMEMKGGRQRGHFSALLLKETVESVNRGEQVLLFQNRRGYAPYVECTECHWVAACVNCNVSLTYHKGSDRLECHYCSEEFLLPRMCPSCGADAVKTKGFGTERVEDEVSVILPGAAVARIDADVARSAKTMRRTVSGFGSGRTDILVGTQMIARGLDFSRVSLVGVMNADNMLNFPDFRAHERAFQALVQLIGCAGVKERRGQVVVQTSQPAHPVIMMAEKNDYPALYHSQLVQRKAFRYPPYTRLVSVVLKGENEVLLGEAAGHLAAALRKIFGTRVLGPEAPPVDRVRNISLLRILIKIERERPFAKAKNLIAAQVDALPPKFRPVAVVLDVDPV